MNPEVGGLLEWRHEGGQIEEWEMYAGRRNQKILPNTTLEREPTLEGRIP